ncbi:MAG: BadF/BadG/BcrA/BcrD ATPase family protein [Roseiarcus sp.]
MDTNEPGEPALYFCVDGGGSRSRGGLFDAEGKALAEAAAGPCNPTTSLDRAVASVESLWGQCCSAVGRPNDRFEGVVFAIGAAGTYIDAGRDAFLKACPPFPRRCAMSDGYAALIGAGSGAPCSLMIVGTGVAGHRLYANGLSIQRDAWGWIGGDRGSGSWIGQRALRHCLAALDGVVAQDRLSRAVLAAIGGSQKLRAGWMRDLGPDRLAALAPLALEQADAGDAMARRIRERAVEHLAALIGVIASPDAPLFAAGGLVPPLRARLSEKAGRAILEPNFDALTGCWLVGSGKAPEERALLFGETVEPDR